MAIKLREIRANCPEDYFYLKGWIHCLLQKREEEHGAQANIQAEQK